MWSSQSKVAVEPSEGDVTEMLEGGETELYMKETDGSRGDREDARQGSIKSNLEKTKVGLVRRGRRLDNACTATVDNHSRYRISAECVRRLGVASRWETSRIRRGGTNGGKLHRIVQAVAPRARRAAGVS